MPGKTKFYRKQCVVSYHPNITCRRHFYHRSFIFQFSFKFLWVTPSQPNQFISFHSPLIDNKEEFLSNPPPSPSHRTVQSTDFTNGLPHFKTVASRQRTQCQPEQICYKQSHHSNVINKAMRMCGRTTRWDFHINGKLDAKIQWQHRKHKRLADGREKESVWEGESARERESARIQRERERARRAKSTRINIKDIAAICTDKKHSPAKSCCRVSESKHTCQSQVNILGYIIKRNPIRSVLLRGKRLFYS